MSHACRDLQARASLPDAWLCRRVSCLRSGAVAHLSRDRFLGAESEAGPPAVWVI